MATDKNNGRLTPKQERFAKEYCVDLNATQAAIRAGYSMRTAEQIGYQQLQKNSVKNRIAMLQGETAERNKITVDGVVSELQRLRDLAVDAGQLGPATRAQELVGKTIGAFVDRHTVTEVSELSDDQLVAAIAGDDAALRQRLRQILGTDGFDGAANTDGDSIH